METTLTYWGFVIGVVGTILSIVGIYLTIKSNKKKEPVYSIKSVNIISDYSSKYNNLTVAYKGKKVENFTVSKVLFYNRGAEIIDRQNLTTKFHIRVLAVECKVLDARLLQANNLSSDFKVEIDRVNGWVIIDFDYLNTNQGAVFEIIHTGTNSENVAFVGDIKGVQKLEQVLPDKLMKSEPMPVRTKIILGFATFVATIGLYLLIFQRDFSMSLFNSYPWFVGAFALLVFAFSMGFPVLILLVIVGYIRGLFVPSNMIPRGLEQFVE
jgi:hypothetical protein